MTEQIGTIVYETVVAGGDDQDDLAVAFGDQLGRTLHRFDSLTDRDSFTQTWKSRLYKSWCVVKNTADAGLVWYTWTGVNSDGSDGQWSEIPFHTSVENDIQSIKTVQAQHTSELSAFGGDITQLQSLVYSGNKLIGDDGTTLNDITGFKFDGAEVEDPDGDRTAKITISPQKITVANGQAPDSTTAMGNSLIFRGATIAPDPNDANVVNIDYNDNNNITYPTLYALFSDAIVSDLSGVQTSTHGKLTISNTASPRKVLILIPSNEATVTPVHGFKFDEGPTVTMEKSSKTVGGQIMDVYQSPYKFTSDSINIQLVLK